MVTNEHKTTTRPPEPRLRRPRGAPRRRSRAFTGLALAAARMEDFEVLDNGLVRVPRSSMEHLFYTVDPQNGGRCSCPDYRWGDGGSRFGFCKHVVAADSYMAFRQHVGDQVSYRIEEIPGMSIYGGGWGVVEVSETPEGFEVIKFTGRDDWIGRVVRAPRRLVFEDLHYEGALLYLIDLMAGVE